MNLRLWRRIFLALGLLVLLAVMYCGLRGSVQIPHMDLLGNLYPSSVKKQNSSMNNSCVLTGSFQENFRRVQKYPEGNASLYYDLIGARKKKPDVMSPMPVFALAANYRYYKLLGHSLRALHEMIMPHYKGARIVVHDIGLTQGQAEELRHFCKCQVRRFPFEKFPPHVTRIGNFAWKAIVVQTLLMEYGFVLWMDCSIRFVKSNIDAKLEYARKNHVWFMTNPKSLSLGYNTDQRMWDFFGEEPCAFFPKGEISAFHLVFHYDAVTRVIVRKWAACALNENCIEVKIRKKCNKEIKVVGRCHRFDQAALGVILRRLYHERNLYPITGRGFDAFKYTKEGKY